MVLVNKLYSNASINLYNIGLYETDIFPISFNRSAPARLTISVTGLLFLLSSDMNKVFILNAGEVVNVQSNAAHDALLSISGNVQRTNELSFFYDLNTKYPETIIKPARLNTLRDLKNADSIFNIRYLNSCNLLNSYLKAKKISGCFTSMASKYLFYNRIEICYNVRLLLQTLQI